MRSPTQLLPTATAIEERQAALAVQVVFAKLEVVPQEQRHWRYLQLQRFSQLEFPLRLELYLQQPMLSSLPWELLQPKALELG